MTGQAPVLVIGSQGQVATALAQIGGDKVARVGRPEIDFDRLDTLESLIAKYRPGAIVNAAAWTAVDAAEAALDAAYRANRDAPEVLARLTREAGIPFIHLSTDYVFSGEKGAPYVETDHVDPTGVYGASKEAGERAVLDANPHAVILRTSWVYAAHGKNFVRTMLNAAQKTNQLKVVGDQIGCPTAARDIAAGILTLLKVIASRPQEDFGGLYHMAGTGSTSWHGLALAVFDAAADHLPVRPEVAEITTAEWPTPAKRPADSRLDCSKLAERFGIRFPAWRDSLDHVVKEIFAGGR